MIDRIRWRFRYGKCPDKLGQFHRRSQAYALRQRLNSDGRQAWTYESLARELGFKSPRAAARAVHDHELYIEETTNKVIDVRQAQYRKVEP